MSYVVATGAIIGVLLLLRSRHGLHFPTPWPDEGSFLWQAINLAESGTLFAPELNPERHILWMPPGYMVITGAAFALFGFSLEFARSLSGLFVALTVAFVAALLYRTRARLTHVAVLGVYVVGPLFQLASNTARMEPLVICIATGAVLLIGRGRSVAGLAVAAFAPMVHPNGVFPAMGLLLLVAYRHALVKIRLRALRWEWGIVGLVGLAYGAYAAYVLAHIDEFVLDIGTQLAWKEAESQMNGGVAERVTRVETLVLLATWVAGAAGTWWVRRPGAKGSRGEGSVEQSLPCVVALAGAFVIQSALTVGWLYDLYAAFGCALVTVVVVEVAVRAGFPPGAIARRATLVAAFAVAVMVSGWVVRQPFLMRSLARATVIRAYGPPYHTKADRKAILRYLGTLAKGGAYTVQFVPAADSLLYPELRHFGVQPIQQTRYDGVADVYVFHDSMWIPRELTTLSALRMGFQQGIAAPVEKWPKLRQRDGTESWRVYRRH